MFFRVALAILACWPAFADVLTLKNGSRIEGTYLGGDARTIRMTVGDRVERYEITDVSSIAFGSGGATSTAAARAPARESASATQLQTRERAAEAPPATAQPASSAQGEVPAGSTITVRMIDSVDSTRDAVGQTFRASLDEPIMIDGEVVVQRGADVLLKLVDQKQSGKLAGQTALTLDVVSLTVNGRTIDVATEEVTQASSSRGARSGKVIGGTAAVGAIIGAIAGGGKGAAIGGLAGAGAGTAAEVLTKGQTVRIPSETRLTFSLQQPIRL